MSVREGYKQTEIGVIPEEWEVVELGDVLDYEQPTKYLVASEEYKDSHKTPVLTAGKTFILGYTSEETGIFNNLPVIIFDDFTTASKYVDFPFKAKSSAMKLLKIKRPDTNLKLIFEYIQQLEFEASTHKRYWISEYQKLKIPLPPLPEQQKIAEILSTVDQKIDSIDSKIEETQTLKRGLMQRLLSEGIGHSEFKESEIGRIPMGWEVVKIGEVCKFTQGVQIPIEEQHTTFQEELVRFLRISDYTQNTSDIRFVPNSYMNNFITSEDIVMVRYGETAGHVGMGFAGVLANNLFTMTPKLDLLSKQYLYHFFKQPSTYEYLKKLRAAGAMPAVNFKSLSIIRIPLPSHKEQEEISKIMFAMDEKLDTLRAKKEAYETLKKGFMQKLLTGEVRVQL